MDDKKSKTASSKPAPQHIDTGESCSVWHENSPIFAWHLTPNLFQHAGTEGSAGGNVGNEELHSEGSWSKISSGATLLDDEASSTWTLVSGPTQSVNAPILDDGMSTYIVN